MTGIDPSANALHTLVLPVPLTPFVGRESEIAHVAQLLLRSDLHLLTLMGPGGVGKTRLALQAVEHVRDQFADGAAIIPLAMNRDYDVVPATLAQSLGVPDEPGKSIPSRLGEFLGDRHMLLMLDNLEHLREIAPLLAGILATCPRITILATSRTRIGISAEHVFPLDTLGSEDARTLFAIRAQAALPSFHLDDESAPVIDAICARLDRLPLAIELAAARIAMLPPRTLLAQLDHRLDLLTDGPRDVPARLRDMRDAISWSYELLTTDQEQAFRRLGVFAGGFTLEAAEAVTGAGPETFRRVATLVDASLVIPIEGVGGEPRFTMLETIREFALEQLVASGEGPDIRRRHAEFYQWLAEEALPHYDGPELPLYNDRVDREIDNCRAAMAWTLDNGAIETGVRLAGALWRVWVYTAIDQQKPWRDRMSEGRSWCERMLARREGLPVEALAEAMAGAALLANYQAAPDNALLLGEELLLRSRSEDYPYGEWWAHHVLGSIDRQAGRFEDAATRFEMCRDIAPLIRNPENHASMSLLDLGETLDLMGQQAQALAVLQDAEGFSRRTGNPFILAVTLQSLGRVLRRQGRLRDAHARFEEALIWFMQKKDIGFSYLTLVEVCHMAHQIGQVEVAARLLGATSRYWSYRHWESPEDSTDTFDGAVAKVRAGLDDAVFADAWLTGTQMTPEDVLADVQALAVILEREPVAATSGVQPVHGLTPREHEVLALIAEGKSNRAIADALSLSERTIENHVLHILTKLGLESRSAAAAYAVRHGLA